jgi:hypothetical protein
MLHGLPLTHSYLSTRALGTWAQSGPWFFQLSLVSWSSSLAFIL